MYLIIFTETTQEIATRQTKHSSHLPTQTRVATLLTTSKHNLQLLLSNISGYT